MDAIPSGDKGLSSGYKATRKDLVSDFRHGPRVCIEELNIVLNSRGNNSCMQKQRPQGYEEDMSLCLLSLRYSVWELVIRRSSSYLLHISYGAGGKGIRSDENSLHHTGTYGCRDGCVTSRFLF
jgi:hypothetical protein